MAEPTFDEEAGGSLLERVLIAAGIALFCSAGFFGIAWLNARRAASGAPYVHLETALDRWIAFDPRWIWIYLSYYPACFVPLLTWKRIRLFRQIAAGYALEFGICFVSFALIHARMAQPPVPGDGPNEWAVRMLFGADPGFNIFPSLHVANALFVAAMCSRVSRPLGRVMWVWAILVSMSTVIVKQHYVVDVVGGALLAALAIGLILRLWDGSVPWERRRPAAAPRAARQGDLHRHGERERAPAPERVAL